VESKPTSEGSGCLIVIVGLVLTPFIIGIPIALYGLHLMCKRESHWRCNRCEALYPRKAHWYDFG
jgi:hypothetical protein